MKETNGRFPSNNLQHLNELNERQEINNEKRCVLTFQTIPIKIYSSIPSQWLQNEMKRLLTGTKRLIISSSQSASKEFQEL